MFQAPRILGLVGVTGYAEKRHGGVTGVTKSVTRHMLFAALLGLKSRIGQRQGPSV